MSDETQALCSCCGKGTSGKIYEDYTCSECYIKALEEENKFLQQEKEKYRRMYHNAEEKRMSYFRYYTAYKVLLKELGITNKN